jgi:cell division protein FtsQ
LVSTNGVVFNASADQPLPHLYGMEGAGPEVSEAYQKFNALLSPLGLAISELSLSARRAWRLKTVGRQGGTSHEAADSAIASKLEIALGRKDAEARLSRFARQYTKIVERLGTAPAYADLRYADGFALKRPSQQLVSQL